MTSAVADQPSKEQIWTWVIMVLLFIFERQAVDTGDVVDYLDVKFIAALSLLQSMEHRGWVTYDHEQRGWVLTSSGWLLAAAE